MILKLTLPLFAGRLLGRLGKPSALGISDEAFTNKLREEQKLRTVERKQAQIVRATKKGKQEKKKAEKSVASGRS